MARGCGARSVLPAGPPIRVIASVANSLSHDGGEVISAGIGQEVKLRAGRRAFCGLSAIRGRLQFLKPRWEPTVKGGKAMLPSR